MVRMIPTTVMAVQAIEAIGVLGEGLDRILLVLTIPATVVAEQVVEDIDLLEEDGEDPDRSEALIAVLQEVEKIPHGRQLPKVLYISVVA
jgi:hypothetical protein